MRVRTITGTTYYTRSGARITGKVHERFMLIDGNRVATGSYRYQLTEHFTHQAVSDAFISQGCIMFSWTDCKLNSTNLTATLHSVYWVLKTP